MKIVAHLNFNGQCEAAMKFYETTLGGKITFMMKFADFPGGGGPPGMGDRIGHSTLTVGDQTIHGADSMPDGYKKPQGFGVALNLSDPAQADRIFTAFAEKGTVGMPIQETFWAQRFGMVTDEFGTPWMINCEKGEQA